MKTVHIEALYPEFCNLYGDTGNLRYLKKKLELCGCAATVTETHLYDRPAFTQQAVDFLYLGPCTEAQQELILPELALWRTALSERMASDRVTLVTGNAPELLGAYIQPEDGAPLPGLSLLPAYAKRFSRLRYNDLCVGNRMDLTVVGFKNQLSHSYTLPDAPAMAPFLQMECGCGRNPDSRDEGFAQGWFFATYLLGPLLPLNPAFSECLLQQLLAEDYRSCELPFEQEAYRRRLSELRAAK